ncbi:MAG: hypothetical protein RTU30_06665, partial [Candidatus Thorarchaeota archaeon]
DQLARQITTVLPRLFEFKKMTQKIRPASKETRDFLEVLKNIERAHSFTLKFSQSMKVEMVAKLKEEYDRGFEFI